MTPPTPHVKILATPTKCQANSIANECQLHTSHLSSIIQFRRHKCHP